MEPSSTIALAIPAYNSAATIGETLDAVQKNDGLDRLAFVVLLDDGSDDDTVAIARRHWCSKPSLEVWSNAENIGERRTTNNAMTRLADRYDWTFFLHADDVVKPNWLCLHLTELNKVPAKVASVCSSYDVWWPETGKIEPGEEFPDRQAVYVPGERKHVIGTLDKGCWWHVSGSAIRNRSFLDIGGFEPDMPQLGDWEWLLRCLAKGYGIWYFPRSTMIYRQHGASVSSQSFREARDLKEKRRILRLMRDRGYLSEADHRLRFRGLVWQMARRTMGRLARGDAHGCRHHSALLIETGLNYVRKQL